MLGSGQAGNIDRSGSFVVEPTVPAFDQRRFLAFVQGLADCGKSAEATPAELTHSALHAWFARSFPKLNGPIEPAPRRLVSKPAIQAFSAVLSELPLLEAAYWLSCAYAKLIRGEQRKALSMYFTPPALVNRVLDDIAAIGADFRNASFLDPACGGAAFLVPIAIRMREALVGVPPNKVIASLQSRLHGMDLDPALCALSRELLRAVLCEEISSCGIEPKFDIREGNSLVDAVDLYGTAGVVVCNPPYRKMTAREVERVRPSFGGILTGQPNLYGVFIAQCTRFLKREGVAAVVTPTSFLSGHSFAGLRTFLLQEGGVSSIGIVGDREGVFMDVRQETAVTIFRKRGQSSGSNRTTISLISTQGEFILVGDSVLPDSGIPWSIPRVAGDVYLIASSERLTARIKDYGYEPRVGNFVWNRDQRKTYVSQAFAKRFNEDAVPLLWASDIKPEKPIHFDGSKKRFNERRFVVLKGGSSNPAVIRKPSVLLQRVTSNDQPRRLVAAAVPSAFFKEYAGFIGENHTITLAPIVSRPLLTPRQLAELFACSEIDRLFRCISGATNVSVFELSQLPLPNPGELKALIAQGLTIQAAVTTLCSRGRD